MPVHRAICVGVTGPNPLSREYRPNSSPDRPSGQGLVEHAGDQVHQQPDVEQHGDLCGRRTGGSAPRPDATTSNRSIANIAITSHNLSRVNPPRAQGGAVVSPVVGGVSGAVDPVPGRERPGVLAHCARHVGARTRAATAARRAPGRVRAVLRRLLRQPYRVLAAARRRRVPRTARPRPALGLQPAVGVTDYLHECGVAGRAAITAQQDCRSRLPRPVRRRPDRGVGPPAARGPAARTALGPRARPLPTISAVADHLENAGIRVLLAVYPEQPPIVPVMSAVTTIKLATGWACIVAIALLAGTAGIRRLNTGRSRVRTRTSTSTASGTGDG